jgi:predicted nuclease of restriction endonuclease-like (RecB) superfamily
MRAFAGAWPEKVPQAVALSPWGHNVVLDEKLDDPETRLWYAERAVENGWARNVLVHQIGTGLIDRQGKALSTLDRTLPAPQSELMQQLVKDPYNFGFLALTDQAHERDVEQGLVDRVCEMLLELGGGFAFVGRQVRLDVDGEEFFLDLLFYCVPQHCYVVVELKIEDFKPEFAGKLSFYTNVVDAQRRNPAIDNPTVGLLLCSGKNRAVAQYSLAGITTPLAVSSYVSGDAQQRELVEHLPDTETLAEKFDEIIEGTVTAED